MVKKKSGRKPPAGQAGAKRKNSASTVAEPSIAAAGRGGALLVAVAICFLLSGFAALLYQAAWLKKLAVVFGTSHIAVATVLAAYMAGLAFGAALAAKWSHLVRRPVLVYGVLEGIIGLSAVLVPELLDAAQRLFVLLYGGQSALVADAGVGQPLYYLAATFLILAVPTGAMGATLPLLSKYAVAEDQQIGPRIGLLYGINTVGAVFGALAAGFVLLPHLGLFGTLWVGAGLNFAIFLIAVWLARLALPRVAADASIGRVHAPVEGVPLEPSLPEVEAGKRATKARFHWVMPVMLVSGVVSFTLEVLWTRLLSHLFGGTVYAFAIMLACFLSGIALGGLLAGRVAKRRQFAGPAFCAAQILVALLSYGAYGLLGLWLPTGDGLLPKALYAFLVMVPSTLFIGATYPLAVRLAAAQAEQAANASGAIYAWNTIGAIVGALVTGFFVLPALGFGLTLKAAMLISLLLALIVGLLAVRKPSDAGAEVRKRGGGALLGWGNKRPMLMPALSAGALLLTLVAVHPQRPDELIYPQGSQPAPEAERYYGVGRSATVLMRDLNGFFTLSSNGLSEAAISRRGMPPMNNSQKWLAGLTTLARPEASSMLVIGFGGGVTLDGAAPHISSLDVVELEPLIIQANQAVGAARRSDPLREPRLNLVVNDARNAVMLSVKRYDAIVSQPSHPWTGGASHLYTREFLALAKSRLREGGVFLQWINSQFVDEALLKTLAATVLEQFSHVQLYQPERHVLLFLASDQPLDVWDGAQGAAKALAAHRRHYNRLGMRAVEDVLAMLTLDDAGLRAFAADAPPNTDGHNRLAMFSRPEGGGLSAEDMQRLFAQLDPLTNPSSAVLQQGGGAFNLAYIAERLLSGQFIQRAHLLSQAVASDHPDLKAVIDALGLHHSGDSQRAQAAFAQALRLNPDNKDARFGLLKEYLGQFAQGQVPQPVIRLANALRGAERKVLEGWVYGAQGRFEQLQALDAALAAVTPTSPAYPIAVKLRADWRVVSALRGDDSAPAKEALRLLDDLLPSFSSWDLLVLRSGCAWLAGDGPAYVESAWAVGRQARQRLEQAEDGKAAPLSEPEAQKFGTRLAAMLPRLREPLTDPVRRRAAAVAAELQEVIERLELP